MLQRSSDVPLFLKDALEELANPASGNKEQRHSRGVSANPLPRIAPEAEDQLVDELLQEQEQQLEQTNPSTLQGDYQKLKKFHEQDRVLERKENIRLQLLQQLLEEQQDIQPGEQKLIPITGIAPSSGASDEGSSSAGTQTTEKPTDSESKPESTREKITNWAKDNPKFLAAIAGAATFILLCCLTQMFSLSLGDVFCLYLVLEA